MSVMVLILSNDRNRYATWWTTAMRHTGELKCQWHFSGGDYQEVKGRVFHYQNLTLASQADLGNAA